MKSKLFPIFLLGLVVASSGCSADTSLSVDHADDEEIIERTSFSSNGLQYDFYKLVNQNSVITHENPPAMISNEKPVRINNSLYQIKRNETGKINTTVAVYNAESAEKGSDIGYNFTERDKEIVEPALNFASDGHSSRLTFKARYTQEEAENSVLLNEESLKVSRNGSTEKLNREKKEQETVKTYKYSKDKVANSTQEHADKIRKNYQVKPNFSNSSEKLVEEALRQGNIYDRKGEDIKRLFEELKAVQPYETDHKRGTWLVEHENKTYWIKASWPGLNQERLGSP